MSYPNTLFLPRSKESLRIQRKYDLISRLYDLAQFPLEAILFTPWRRMLFSRIEGKRVLEIGVGTGKNFKFYPTGSSERFGIDLSQSMLARAKAKARKYGVKTNLLVMDLEKLGFSDDFFDEVTGTFIFCTVANPVSCLREIRRVLKPRGKLYLLEHMRPDGEMLGKFFDWINPLGRLFGPNLNRRTIENLTKAGFRIEKVQNLLSSIYRYVIARPLK